MFQVARLAVVLVVAVALGAVPRVSWSQVPGGILDQQRSQGLSLLTVVAPPPVAPAAEPPAASDLPPAEEKFLCWYVWYARTDSGAWVMLTDAPDTHDGRIFTQEAIKSITSAPATARWTVRRLPDEKALVAESERIAAQLDAAGQARPSTAAWLKSLARKVFRIKK